MKQLDRANKEIQRLKRVMTSSQTEIENDQALLMGKLHQLEGHFKKYGRHLFDCRNGPDCTCGFDTVLEKKLETSKTTNARRVFDKKYKDTNFGTEIMREAFFELFHEGWKNALIDLTNTEEENKS